jgi:hypothetical protein
MMLGTVTSRPNFNVQLVSLQGSAEMVLVTERMLHLAWTKTLSLQKMKLFLRAPGQRCLSSASLGNGRALRAVHLALEARGETLRLGMRRADYSHRRRRWDLRGS